MTGLPAVVLGDGPGVRTRMARVAGDASWRLAVAAHEGSSHTDGVPEALDRLVDAAVTFYAGWGRSQPIMLVHAATAPRAAALALPSLPAEQWLPTYDTAWRLTAALTSAYRSEIPSSAVPQTDRAATDDSDDEHAIKFAEVGLESHDRGNPTALAAIRSASTWIEDDN